MVTDELRHRVKLEREFNEWAKAIGARPDVFNMLVWLQDKQLLLTNRKRQVLTEMRDEFRRIGWMETAKHLDDVLS